MKTKTTPQPTTQVTTLMDEIHNLPIELKHKVMFYALVINEIDYPVGKIMKEIINLHNRYCEKYEEKTPFNIWYKKAYYTASICIFFPDIYENEEFKE